MKQRFSSKLLSMLLTLCMVATMIPFSGVLAAESGYDAVGDFVSYTENGNDIDIQASGADLRIELCQDNMARVRMKPSDEDYLPNEEFLVVKYDWDPVEKTVSDEGEYLKIATAEMVIRVYKNPVSIAYYQPDNETLITKNSDADALGYKASGESATYFDMDAAGETEDFYGLGTNGNAYNWRSKSMRVWMSDQNKHNLTPFFISTNGYGIYAHTSFGSTFDFTTNVYSIELEGGQMDYYFIADEEPVNIVADYNTLTGSLSMPPKKALGLMYRGSGSWNADDFKRVIGEFRDNKVPIDYVGLEPGWQTSTYPCTYVWSGRFPDPGEFSAYMRDENHVSLNLWCHPFLDQRSPMRDPDTADNPYNMNPFMFSHNHSFASGNGGKAIDFTSKDSRDTFYSYIKKVNGDIGIHSYKIDEVDQFIDESAVLPSGMTGKEYHNLFGSLAQKVVHDGTRENFGIRTFTYDRGLFTGSQRYPSAGYSDTYNINEYIRLNVNAGFSGGYVSPELRADNEANEVLFQRRTQLSFFSAYALENEWQQGSVPWERSAVSYENFKKYANLRMKLVPYIYSNFQKQSEQGVSFLRPLVLDFPLDKNARNIDMQYMFGDALMVAPVSSSAEIATVSIYLPAGSDWYDYWTGEKYTGGKTISYEAPSDVLPMFVKAGSIVPMGDVIQYVEPAKTGDVTLDIYPGKDASSYLYEDDGETFDYETGEYAKTDYAAQTLEGEINIQLSARTGSYAAEDRDYYLNVHTQKEPESVAVDGVSLEKKASMQDVRDSESGYFYDFSKRVIFAKFADDTQAKDIVIKVDTNEVYDGDINAGVSVDYDLKVEDDFRVAYNWSAVGATMTEDVNNGSAVVAVKPEAQSGSISRGFVDINTELYPYFKFKVDSTTGQYAVKMTTGVTETTVYPQSSAGGVFIVPYKELMGLSGVNTIKVTLEAIGENSQTKFGFVKFTGAETGDYMNKTYSLREWVSGGDSQALISYSNPGIKLTNVFSDGHQNPYAGMNRQFVVDIDRTPYLRVNVASYSNASADVKLKTEGTEVSLGSLGTDTTKLYDIRELTGLSGTHIVTVNPAVLGGNGSSVTFDSIEFLNEQDASMETNRTGASWQPDSGRIATSLGTEGVEIRQSGRDVNIDEGWGAVSKDLFIDFSKVSHLKLNLATYSSTLYKLSIRDAEGHSYELKASDDSSVNSIVKLDKAAMQQAGLSVEGMQRYTVVIGMNDFRPTQEGVVTIKAMQFIAAATVDRFDSVYSYEQWSMNDKQAQLSYLNPGLKLTNVMTDTSKNESASVSRSYYVDLDATPYLSISAADFTGGAQYLCKVMVPGSVGETVAITGNSAQTRIINLKALLGLEGLQYVTIIPTVVGGDGAAFTLNAVGFISTVSGEGISGIRIDGEPLQDFAKDRTSYEVNIDSSSSTLPVVSVDKEDDSVEVGIEQATPVSPTAVITVVNKNGEVYTYTINFTDAYATWLSDIDWKSATAGVANGVRKDTSYENPLSLKDADGNVVRYNKGVSAHANATIIYDIRDKGYDAFEAIVGVNALKNDSRSSINIMVYVDGVKAVETGEMKVDTPAKYLNVALTGKSELKLVVDGLGDISADHADFCNAKLLTSQYKVTYASDIDWVSATAGAGTVQKDRSHEFALAVKDAKKNIMLYQKGLGTHAQSEIVYNIEGRNYLKFEAMVGVNAIKNRETSSVNFMVYADGVKVYESGTLKVNDAAKRVSVNLEGVKELKLVSDKADGSIDSDHADWCDAKFLGVRGDDPQPPDVKDFEMRDNWTIVNEDDLYYHIDSKDQITMTATQGDFSSGIRNAKNIVVSDVSGDYTVTTRLKFSPDTRYQTAGLMIYGDNDNYFSAFKRFHPSFGGNCFTANHLHNMDFSEQPVSDPHPDQDVWLKIEKNGTLFVASYSYDNENWTEIGRKDNPDLASMQMKAGIYAVASTIDTTPDIPAVFSEYKVNGEPVLFGYKPQVREGYGELGLRENWSVVRENPEKYTVNEDGSITLTCVLGDLTGGAGSSAQNMVMTPVSGDFTTKVKVAFANPDTVFQTAGFVIYGDDNTSFAITKRFHNAFGGNCFSANNLDNGSFSEQPKPDTQAADDVWMKIEKTGNLFIASISYDDETWTEIGRKENAALAGMDMKVGIYSGYGGVGIVAPEIPATFRDLGVNGELLPFGVFKEAISSEHFNEKYGEVTVLENLGYSAFLSLFGQQKGEIVLKDAEGNAVKGNVQNGYTMELVVDGAVTDRADIITTNDVDVEAGDVDYSGSRGVADLLMVKSYILQRTDFAKWQFEAADVNKDGIINIFDLVEIKFMILRG